MNQLRQKLEPLRQKLLPVARTLGRWASAPLARRLVYGLFVVQAVYLVFMIPIGVPPDELAHIRIVEQYTQQSHWSPVITEQTNYSLGDITRNTDYFYHYILSLVARVLPLEGLPLYVVFRFMSVGIVLLTLIASARLLRRIGASPATITVGLLIVSNVAQILFMSAAINQDQVVWLATALGGLFLVRMWRKITVVDSLALVNIVMFGAISKKTFLPIAALYGVLWLVIIWLQREKFVKAVKKSSKLWTPAVVSLALLAVVGIGLNVERFGGNLLNYQQISVSCDKIHAHEQCMEHGVYRRNANLTAGRPAEFTPIPFSDFTKYWYKQNFRGVFGTQGWSGRAEPPDWAFDLLLNAMTISLVLGFAYSVRNWRRPESMIYTTSLGYIAVQMMVNYNVYITYAAKGLALQGRYIFPIFIPLVLTLGYMGYQVLRRYPLVLMILAITVAGLVITQSGLMMIVDSGLYTDTPWRPVILFDPDNAISEFEPGV